MKGTEGREGKQQKNGLLVRGRRRHLGKMIFILSLLLMSIIFSQNKQYPSLPLGYSIRPDQLLPRWNGKITKGTRIRQFYPIQRITTDPADDIQPAWSPDGRTIVFVSNRINKRDGHDLYAINADGTNERLLAKFIVTDPWGGRFGCPNWLGNTGDIILMDYKFYWEIMRFRLSEAIRDNVLPVERAVWDGDSPYITRLIFVPPGYNPYKSPSTISPISSPDGSKIAFHYDSYREGKWVVRIYENSLNGYIGSIDDVGRTVFSVSSDGAIGADFKPMAFSPDGQKLVISACETGWAQGKRRDLYVVDITSGMRYMLTNTGSQGVDHGYVSWSSQNWIAFAMRQSDESSYDLYIIRPDGTGLTRLTDTPWNEIDPSWSPDGTKLVFASDKEGNYDLYVMEIFTSNRPPSVPVLLSPAKNATVSPTPTFKVKSEDPDGDQVKFEIEVVKGSETKRFETGFFVSGSEATFTVPENQSLSEGQWSWRARAIDNKGAASDWSSALTFTVQVQVAKPDLVPKDLTLSASEVEAGKKVTVRFKVVNQGQAKANPSKTNVRLSPSPDRPTKDDPLLVSFDTPALDPNQSVTHEAEVTIPAETKAGDYYVWVIVDVDSTAGQSDESNDRIKAPLKVKTANRPPVLTKIESPPDKGVATGQPWFRMQAEDPDGDRVTYRIELKYYSSPPSLPSTFPTPDYVFDQKAAESKGWWMPGDEWRQTENRRVQSRAYASGAIAQFQPKAKLREGYYLWRVIVTDERGAVYETPREKWKTFRVIHHNPIVLVHGFNFGGILKQILWGQLAGAQLPLNNPANWNEAVKVIKSFGYIPLYEAYHEDTQTHVGSANDYADLFVVDNLNTSLRVDTNGNLMREYMFREVRPRISYETVVDLIGHSMGGLIARAYVGLLREKVGRGWAVSLAFNGEVGVERIVTLGTPHSGASLADAWWAKLLKWLFKDLPAVQDLSLEGACNLNKAYPVTEGIQYLLFAAEIDVSALLANIFHPGSVTLKSDGIVDVESAHWKWYCKREQRRRPSMPNVIEIPPLNMGFDWLAHFNLISPETTRWWMAQYLRKGGFKSYKVIATNQQKRQQLEETQSTELWLSFVQQGQEISREVFLDETSDAAFITNWLVGQISFTLQSPTGQQITPEQAREGGDIQFFEIPHILGTFKVFLIKNASQGRWVMRVRGESEIPPDGTPALMWAAFHSPLKLNVDIPKAIYSIGEGAVLKAQLMKASQPVTGATVTAEVIQPDGQSVTVNLLDDGEHQDGKAGDGVYGAVLTNLTEPGTYRFIVTAKGQTRQEGGTNFERSAMGSFEVASPAARLTGRYTDEGMDEDNDGLFERLRVDVQVQIQQAGSFTLSGALADGAGRTITQTSVSFEATEAGVMTISLFFDGQAIGNWNYSGRFQLRDVTLLHRTDRGMVFADSHDHPYDTREYQANQFPSTLIRQSIALREGLHFVSVPMDLVNAGWSFLLGQIPSEVKVAVWMGNGYVFYPQEPANEAQTGRGYWVKLLPGQVRELTAIGRKVSEEQPFVLPLRQGWNAIGNPFLASLTWNLDSLKVRKGTEEKTLEQAQQAEWIEDYAWGWEQDANNPNTGRYVLVYDTSIIPGVKGQLEPWKGYWVYAHTDCELILPPPSQSKGRGTRGEGRGAKGNGWSMRLQASVNGSVGEAVLGIANGTRGLAVGLPPEPPTGNNGVQVILLKNNTPLAVDVRSDGSRRQEWEVLVRFGTRDGGRGTSERKEVVLTFDVIGYAPKDVSAWLVDTVTGKRLYLRTQPSYHFVAQEGEVERKFKVVVDRGNDRPLRVVGLKATPMRGQGVVIEFSLTKPAKVEAEVLTLTGRKVAVLDAGSSEGLTRRVVWRGVGIEGQKVGSGVYLVRVRAVDEEGREVQAATVVRLR